MKGLLLLNGRKDFLTPPAGIQHMRDHLLPLYQRFGKAEDRRFDLFDLAHEELPETHRLVLDCIDRHLVKIDRTEAATNFS